MLTTKPEPLIFRDIKEFNNASIIDSRNEVIPYLKEQYEYEVRRVPRHPLFAKRYTFPYFRATYMLNFYLNPIVYDSDVSYIVEEDSPDYMYPIIHKRTSI